MTIKNEALRMFLAATALILTCMLSQPLFLTNDADKTAGKSVIVKRTAASSQAPVAAHTSRKYVSIAGFRFRR